MKPRSHLVLSAGAVQLQPGFLGRVLRPQEQECGDDHGNAGSLGCQHVDGYLQFLIHALLILGQLEVDRRRFRCRALQGTVCNWLCMPVQTTIIDRKSAKQLQ